MYPLIDTIYVQVISGSLVLLLAARLGLIIWQALLRQRLLQRSLLERINRLLPQTQCGQCGYEGCLPYAREICRGDAINKCPPGGPETIVRLAALMHRPVEPLNPAHGQVKPFAVAVIREAECIGCTKCIQACPVDAIIGGPKLMHTVIEQECTGCDLCVEPCPVDCIDMISREWGNPVIWLLPSSGVGVRQQLDTAV